jgi:hypothetical protein
MLIFQIRQAGLNVVGDAGDDVLGQTLRGITIGD